MTFSERLQLNASIFFYNLRHTSNFAAEHWHFFETMCAFLESRFGSITGKRFLDIGCGKSFWLTLLLHSRGAKVVGIDKEQLSSSFRELPALLRSNGLERTLRTLVWKGLFAVPYYRRLASFASFPLSFRCLSLRQMVAEKLHFEDETFDVVVSHEAFEHLPNVPAALAEVARVLKPNGITYIYIHNYASLSGGHHIAWKYPDSHPSKIVPPWDHLREKRFSAIPSWINRLRMKQYKVLFQEHLEIIDWLPGEKEGVKLLTTEIQKELAEYDPEELTTKGFTVVACRKDASP